MDRWIEREREEKIERVRGWGVGKGIVFVVVLFRRFLINDGYFEKDQMKKFLLLKYVNLLE